MLTNTPTCALAICVCCCIYHNRVKSVRLSQNLIWYYLSYLEEIYSDIAEKVKLLEKK